MIDMSNDGIGENLDTVARVTGMEAMRILEAVIRRRREDAAEAEREAAANARELQARYDSQATLARAELAPVMGEKFWQDSDLNTIRERYVRAAAFAEVDESFVGYRDRIAEKVAETRGGMTPEQLLEGPVPPGPRPMTEGQAKWAAENIAPRWYQAWSAEEIRNLDKIKDPEERAAAQVAHAGVVRSDLEHWRDHGVMSVNAQEVQDRWEAGDISAKGFRNVDPSEKFATLTDDQRTGLGWRPGGPQADTPLTVDDARLLATTTAPDWYRLHEVVAQDPTPALREKYETRLVEDMTALRETGRLETASAKEEWARFSGHELSVQSQDPNESLTEWQTRRTDAYAVHWAATELERERVSDPAGHHVGKPMSVAQAEEFAEKFAPEWLATRHHELLEAAARNEDPERAAWEQRNLREQYRYAMEHARDTGTLSHPYTAGLRDQAAFMGQDESEGMRHVSSQERVRFGGPAARPMSDEEAKEVMAGWAPSWYQDHMRRTLREGTELSDSARRSAMDSLRADMTQVRDRGTLSTDHAQRVWASSQPGFDPSDPDSRKAMDRREQTWVETAGQRDGVAPMDQNNRERFGGRRDSELDTQPIPLVSPKEDEAVRPDPQEARERDGKRPEGEWEVAAVPGADAAREARERAQREEEVVRRRKEAAKPEWDTVERREAAARAARRAGQSMDAVDGMTAVDYGHSRPPAKGGGKPEQFDQWVEDAIRAKAMTQEQSRTR